MTAQLDIIADSGTGYTPRQLADFQTAINAAHALIVDPKTGQVPFQNNTDDTILMQVVGIIAEAIGIVDNSAAWLATASGALLDALVQLNGIIKKRGAPTVLLMALRNGTPGGLVIRGSIISEEGGERRSYETSEDVVLDANGYAEVNAICTTMGEYVPALGTVVSVQTPTAVWNDATNIATVSAGTLPESDAELRLRQQVSTNATSYRQIEAIEAAVLNVPGVTFARSYQNRELETDDRGIPGKTLSVVAVGGDEFEICTAIRLRSPLGIRYFGNVSRTFTDINFQSEVVRFSRPTQIPIFLRINGKIVNDERIQVFPANGRDLIKDAIVGFAVNGKLPCNTNGNTGFPPGQDIIRSYLGDPINRVGGFNVQSIETSTDGGQTWASADVVIPWNAIGVILKENIEVIAE